MDTKFFFGLLPGKMARGLIGFLTHMHGFDVCVRPRYDEKYEEDTLILLVRGRSERDYLRTVWGLRGDPEVMMHTTVPVNGILLEYQDVRVTSQVDMNYHGAHLFSGYSANSIIHDDHIAHVDLLVDQELRDRLERDAESLGIGRYSRSPQRGESKVFVRDLSSEDLAAITKRSR